MSENPITASLLVAHGDPGIRGQLDRLAQALGHSVIGSVETCEALVAASLAARPDLIVSGLQFPDGSGLEALTKISEKSPRPSIIVTRKDYMNLMEKTMADHIMACLVHPISEDNFRLAILLVLRRFAEFEGLRKENEQLRDALMTRKKLERAKGILMLKEGISEEEAYLRLRNLATGKRVKLGEVADEIIRSSIEKNPETT